MDTNLLAALLKAAEAQGAAGAVGGGSNWMLLLIALIGTLPATVAAVMGFLKASKAVADVKEVHLSINSRLDEWLKVERAQGKTEGKQEAKAEVKAVESPVAESRAQQAGRTAPELASEIVRLQAELAERIKTGNPS